MLVSGAGDIKLTKDGNVLLHEMQIQHPTASIIAKVAAAQDHVTGDGTTSNVLIIGELLKQADLYISEGLLLSSSSDAGATGLHPRIIAEGFDVAKTKALEVLDEIKVQKEMKRDILLDVARTSLRTKVHTELADILTEAVVDSVLAIRRPGIPIDLFMVEIVEMRHKSETDTQEAGVVRLEPTVILFRQSCESWGVDLARENLFVVFYVLDKKACWSCELDLMEAFLKGGSFLFDNSSLCQVDTKPASTDRVSLLNEALRLVRGLVLDHGARHPRMRKQVQDAYILICNVSLEYEKTEVSSGFFYKTVEEKEKLVKAERKFIEDRVQKIIDLKQKVCAESNKGFVVINQKGIDPVSLEMLAKHNIVALRRAKRRNLERPAEGAVSSGRWESPDRTASALGEQLTLACGGVAVNSFEDLSEECLGHAGLVFEYALGEEKFTFIEDCVNPLSVTLLVKGPNKHTLIQIKDALRDGLRAVKNAIEDGGYISFSSTPLCNFMLCFHKEWARSSERLPSTEEGRCRNSRRGLDGETMEEPVLLLDLLPGLCPNKTKQQQQQQQHNPPNHIRLHLMPSGCVVPGAGAAEVAIAEALVNYKHRVQGRARLGIQAFADALLIIPKVLAQNSGYDLQETLIKIQTKHAESKELVGIDLNTAGSRWQQQKREFGIITV
ncbi:T-complex protein 1 subunit zeta-2 [Apodemus speciosus]|uniref:T-complex protein 1 subunit zeta-2 n=1 Tax=Apodemus speciosus TaxID=105296 RepID=A0ABQ0FBE4_APOSI